MALPCRPEPYPFRVLKTGRVNHPVGFASPCESPLTAVTYVLPGNLKRQDDKVGDYEKILSSTSS